MSYPCLETQAKMKVEDTIILTVEILCWRKAVTCSRWLQRPLWREPWWCRIWMVWRTMFVHDQQSWLEWFGQNCKFQASWCLYTEPSIVSHKQHHCPIFPLRQLQRNCSTGIEQRCCHCKRWLCQGKTLACMYLYQGKFRYKIPSTVIRTGDLAT